MGRSVFAGLIAVASLIHMGTLVAGFMLGWFETQATSMLLLAGAFLLALFALASSLWILRGTTTLAHDVSGFFLDCHECGRPADHEHTFCIGCGAHV